MWKYILMAELCSLFSVLPQHGLSRKICIWLRWPRVKPDQETSVLSFSCALQGNSFVCLNLWKVSVTEFGLKNPIGLRNKWFYNRKCWNRKLKFSSCSFIFFSVSASHKWLFQIHSNFTTSLGYAMALHFSANKLIPNLWLGCRGKVYCALEHTTDWREAVENL